MPTLFGRRFRPRFWPSLAALAGIAVLVALGTWQLQRLAWKEALIAEREALLAQPPGALPADLSDPEALEYLPVRVTGRYLHERELHLVARVRDRQTGIGLMTPLRLDDGRALLVDRGWVPPELADADSEAVARPKGEVTVTGTLRAGGWRGSDLFRPANEPARNRWLWPDLPAMAEAAGLESAVTSVYLVADAEPGSAGYPIGRTPEVTLTNDHLEYALTWYALAFALLVIYLLHQSRPEQEERTP